MAVKISCYQLRLINMRCDANWDVVFVWIHLSLGSLLSCRVRGAGDSGHWTVSGPSDEGVSVVPPADEPSPICCSSVMGCSSIQLASTSMVRESTSPVTPKRYHKEVRENTTKNVWTHLAEYIFLVNLKTLWSEGV